MKLNMNELPISHIEKRGVLMPKRVCIWLPLAVILLCSSAVTLFLWRTDQGPFRKSAETSIAPDMPHLPLEYERYLSGLTFGSPDAIPHAVAKYREYAVRTSGVAIRDRLFRSFKAFFAKAQPALIEKFFPEEEPGAFTDLVEGQIDGWRFRLKDPSVLADEHLRKKVTMIKRNGLALFPSESGEYLAEDPDFLLGVCGGWVSKGIRDFLKLRSEELQIGRIVEDAAIMLDWDELGDRIAGWDSYIKKHPDYPEIEEARNYVVDYLRLYLVDLQLDNTPMFIEGRLVEELRESYERFLREYPGSDHYQLIACYYDLLARHDFALSSEARDYLEAKGL